MIFSSHKLNCANYLEWTFYCHVCDIDGLPTDLLHLGGMVWVPCHGHHGWHDQRTKQHSRSVQHRWAVHHSNGCKIIVLLLLPAFCTRTVAWQSWIICREKKIYIFWEAVAFVKYIFSSLQQHMQVQSNSIAEINQTPLVLIISKQRLRKRQLLLRPSMEIFTLVVGLNLTTSCSNLHLSPQAILNISEPRLRL